MTGAAPRMQRAEGLIHVAVERRGQRTALARLRHEGCLKARFPRGEAWLEMVTVNLSGGVAAGDRLSVQVEAGAGTRFAVAGLAAERFYRAMPGSAPAALRSRVTVGDGAAVEWLPQESILFDGCALDRSLEVDLAEGASFVGVESLVFGRAAMGERVERIGLRDLIQVRRGGRLVLHDAVRLDGDVRGVLGRAAVAGGMGGVATVVYAGAEAPLETVRRALDGVAAEGGASAWDGLVVARILAEDGARLRRAVAAVLGALRAGRDLPRVWRC